MLFKVPEDASPDVQQAFRDVNDLLEKILGGRNIDFKGRRVINAGDAQAAKDYTTRDDVVRIVRASGAQVNNDGTPLGYSGQAVR